MGSQLGCECCGEQGWKRGMRQSSACQQHCGEEECGDQSAGMNPLLVCCSGMSGLVLEGSCSLHREGPGKSICAREGSV